MNLPKNADGLWSVSSSKGEVAWVYYTNQNAPPQLFSLRRDMHPAPPPPTFFPMAWQSSKFSDYYILFSSLQIKYFLLLEADDSISVFTLAQQTDGGHFAIFLEVVEHSISKAAICYG